MMTAYNPISSYRIQFSRSFAFKDLDEHLGYLSLLGTGCVYASPIFTAVPGSAHGYDAINPLEINPDLGSRDEFKALSARLADKSIGWIQDIVPNHMAFHSGNQWLWDVLEKGADSNYFMVFDFEPEVVEQGEKLMLPVLGDKAEAVIQKRELAFRLHDGRMVLVYHEHCFPVNFASWQRMIAPHIKEAPLPFRELCKKFKLDRRQWDKSFLDGGWEAAKVRLKELCEQHEDVNAYMESLLAKNNRNPQSLQELVAAQHYEPCHWKETATRINYRRFFTINDLICLRMEDQQVMRLHHGLLNELMAAGHINGVRVDHVDGLRNPTDYLQRLRAMASRDKYVIVEKILEHDEQLPSLWPVDGSTGYDFLGMLSNLLTAPQNHDRLQTLYKKITGCLYEPAQLIYDCRKMVLTQLMGGEWENLSRRFENLLKCGRNEGLLSDADIARTTVEERRRAIGEFILACPVYRYYPGKIPLAKEEKEALQNLLNRASARNPQWQNAFSLLEKVMAVQDDATGGFKSHLEDFMQRAMQYCAPLAAKGIEDTAMYKDYSLLAHNEVGDRINAPGMSPATFHQTMQERLAKWPLAMNATASHDTKRGEDTRARLLAITDLAEAWEEVVTKWFELNQDIRKTSNSGKITPLPNDEYLIYQTLAATFPFDEVADATYLNRIQDYMVKALREGRQNSQWENPNEEYEQAVCEFVAALMQPERPFFSSFLAFHRRLAWLGMRNSLTQLAIKCLAPGIPDIYRGTEMWDFSLVDPDNRRPVDFKACHRHLLEVLARWRKNPAAAVRELQETAPDGQIKLWLTHVLLQERRRHPDMYRHGDYIPLDFEGKFKNHVFGFIRRYRERWLMCVVPLRTGTLPAGCGNAGLVAVDWGDTRLKIPADAPEKWRNLLTGQELESEEKVTLAALFDNAPLAILAGSRPLPNRRAGVLLHISSLPGKHGIGDLGDEAFRFVDFLNRTRQSHWQLLPLGPLAEGGACSPYSSPSAMACNPLLINLYALVRQGLLAPVDVQRMEVPESSRVDYQKAGERRRVLLAQAWQKLKTGKNAEHLERYRRFCLEQADWLDDYSLFVACRKAYDGQNWNQWPAALRDRQPTALKEAEKTLADDVEFEKFCQFVFADQWSEVKNYANARGIEIFGDMPFYVSYNSADVWAHQSLFKLKKDRSMAKLAGVPPDYFNANGQLWNMPVFNWEKNRQEDYTWWRRRITRNLELYDLLRIDHFRALSSFWEVPAGAENAKAGKWCPGPGDDLLRAFYEDFPNLPLVAEDLGDIDQTVYDLRDRFALPGMRVLQFSFDHRMAANLHTPHNHSYNSLVFAGTHDNNTIRGWFARELDKAGRKRLSEYSGKTITSANVHWQLIRMALASPAKLAIISMQDYLGLGEEARMNKPATTTANWRWKMTDANLSERLGQRMAKLTLMYNR